MRFQNNYSYSSKSTTKQISFIAFYLAIFLVLTFIPYTGYIRISIVQITTLPILIAFATYHFGFTGAITSSLGFGVGSYLQAITEGDPTQLFVLPDIAILSRFFLGLSIYLIYKIMGSKKLWKFCILAGLSVIFNTFWVTVVIFTHNAISPLPDFRFNSIFVWLSLIYINFIIEFIVSQPLAFPFYKLFIVLEKNGLTFI